MPILECYDMQRFGISADLMAVRRTYLDFRNTCIIKEAVDVFCMALPKGIYTITHVSLCTHV